MLRHQTTVPIRREPAAASSTAATERTSVFGQVLLELVETERSYITGLDALQHSYRPALQPIAPTVLTQLFAALSAVKHTSEELLGRVEFILEGYLLSTQHSQQRTQQPEDREQWAAAALAEAFTPGSSSSHGSSGSHGGSSSDGLANGSFETTRCSATALTSTTMSRPSSASESLMRSSVTFAMRCRQVAEAVGLSQSLQALVITPSSAHRATSSSSSAQSVVQRRLGSSLILEHPCRRFVAEGELLHMQEGGQWAVREAVLFNDMLLLCSTLADVSSSTRRETESQASLPRSSSSSAPAASSSSTTMPAHYKPLLPDGQPHASLRCERIAELTPEAHILDTATPAGARAAARGLYRAESAVQQPRRSGVQRHPPPRTRALALCSPERSEGPCGGCPCCRCQRQHSGSALRGDRQRGVGTHLCRRRPCRAWGGGGDESLDGIEDEEECYLVLALGGASAIDEG